MMQSMPLTKASSELTETYFITRRQTAHKFHSQAQANDCCHAAVLNSWSECDPETDNYSDKPYINTRTAQNESSTVHMLLT